MGFLGAVVQQGMGIVQIAMADGERQAAFDRNKRELQRGWESEEAAAADAMARSGHEAGKTKQQASQVAGAQRVAFAANNMVGSTGTAAKLADVNEAAGLDNAETIRANALAEALGHRQTAGRYRAEVQKQAAANANALSSSMIGWAGDAVKGAADFMGKGGGM